MTKKELEEWFFYYTQYKNGYHLSSQDRSILVHLNHLVMEASHEIHNENMLVWLREKEHTEGK